VNYKHHIEEFKTIYTGLNISVTSKMHAVFYHIPEFCEKKQCGLGAYSEQASEAVHYDFECVWDNFKIKSFNHPHFKKTAIASHI
jgi:hypothetical protein